MREVYLESHKGRRYEPAELFGLRKQVTEAKEGVLELRRKKAKTTCLWEEEGERHSKFQREKGWGKVWAAERARGR